MAQVIRTMAISAALALLGGYAAAEDAPIPIGVDQPLTGAFAASGSMVANGAKLAADEINTRGGINGRKIRLVTEDNKSNPTEAANAAEKLLTEDKVQALVGAWGSSLTLAVMPKLMQYKVPMVVETSSADRITTSGNPYVFRISPTNSVEAKGFAKYVKDLGIKKADFLVVNNDWGIGAAAEFGKVVSENGGTVGQTMRMDADAQDLSAQLSSIKDDGADTLFLTSSVEQMTLVMKQAHSLGINRRVITTGGTLPDQLIAQAGSAADNSYHDAMFTPWFPEATADPSVAKRFIAAWGAAGYPPAGMTEGARGYDAVVVLAKAIEKAATPDAAGIRAALWNVDYAGLTGQIKFEKAGPSGRESGQSFGATHLVKIENGKIVLVGQ